jgi:hypothetical protein
MHDRSIRRFYGEDEFSAKKYNDNHNHDVLHVVTSRFMQGQSTLNALAKARLRLFETFCLPTMLNQKADNFLWFVMTDPQLDPELLHHLQSLLEPRPNFYLVTSNAKLLTPSNLTNILSAEHQDSADAAAYQKVLLTGDIDLLRNQMLDPNRPLLLETRLDADDGLHSDTLSQIQTIAKALPVDTRGWQIICNNIHYEWRNDDISVIDPNITKISSSGKLRIVKESICVTPGYTLVRHREPPSIDFPSWPKIGHNLVAREWPECKFENASIVGEAVETKTGNFIHDCWKKMAYFPAALRSRTVTSAGMSRVETKLGEEKYENRTKMFWEQVQRDFDIAPESARLTSQYIKDNLHSIALDNLIGQW